MHCEWNGQIKIPIELLQKVMIWTSHAKGEFSCLGTMNITNDTFLIEKLYMMEQDNTPASTTVSGQAIITTMRQANADEETTGDLRVWIHSHKKMEAFWSTADEKAIENLSGTLPLVSIVVNEFGEMVGRIDFWSPHRMKFKEVKVSPIIPSVFDDEEIAAIEDELSEKEIFNIPQVHKFGRYWQHGTNYTECGVDANDEEYDPSNHENFLKYLTELEKENSEIPL